MNNILFEALAVCLLYTVVCPQFAFSFLRSEEAKTATCLIRKGIRICFPEKDANSYCTAGVALPDEKYQHCIHSLEICDSPGRFEIQGTPSRYYECTFNPITGVFDKKVMTCKEGKYFDPRTLECLNPEELLVSKGIPQVTQYISPRCLGSKTIPDSYNCKSFYICDKFRAPALKFSCGPKMYFNEKSKICTTMMTRACLRKFRYTENNNIKRARKHYEVVKEIMKDPKDPHKIPGEILQPEIHMTVPEETARDDGHFRGPYSKCSGESEAYESVEYSTSGVSNTEGVKDDIRSNRDKKKLLQKMFGKNDMLENMKKKNSILEKLREKNSKLFWDIINFIKQKVSSHDENSHNRHLLNRVWENTKAKEIVRDKFDFPNEYESGQGYQPEDDYVEDQVGENDSEESLGRLKFIRQGRFSDPRNVPMLPQSSFPTPSSNYLS